MDMCLCFSEFCPNPNAHDAEYLEVRALKEEVKALDEIIVAIIKIFDSTSVDSLELTGNRKQDTLMNDSLVSSISTV